MRDKLKNAEELDNSNFIFQTLKNEIITLAILPGTVLSENDICTRFSVSRTPVRSALKRLSDMKLINIVPYKKMYVSRINFHHLNQMIYMRIAIESKVIRDFIDVYDSLTLEKLRHSLKLQQIKLEHEFIPKDFYAMDAAFHRVWFSTMDKVFLWRKIQHSLVHYTRFRMLDYVETEKYPTLLREHEQIFSIIAKKKKEEVEPFLIKHLNGGIKRLGKRIYTELAEYFELDTGKP